MNSKLKIKIKQKYKKGLKIAHIHVFDKKNKGDFAIVLAVQELLRKEFKNCEIINLPVESLKLYSDVSINKINKCDLVFIGGGGIFYSYFMPFDKKVISSIQPPIYLFGLGYIKEIGAKDWPQKNIDSVIFLADRAKGVGVRDLNTKRFLETNGLKKGKVKVIGDPAVLLSEKKPNKEV